MALSGERASALVFFGYLCLYCQGTLCFSFRCTAVARNLK